MPLLRRSFVIAFFPALFIFMAFEFLHFAAKQEAAADERVRLDLAADRAAAILTDQATIVLGNLRNVSVVVQHAKGASVSSTAAFHDFIEDTELFATFPAVRGVAIMQSMTDDSVDAAFDALNADTQRRTFGYDQISLKNPSDTENHAVITMLSPLNEMTKGEIGIDILARPRSQTFRDAIGQNELRMSPPFELFDKSFGAAIFYPFAMAQDDPAPTAVVASVFAAGAFMDGLSETLSQFGFRIDVNDIGPTGRENNSEGSIPIASLDLPVAANAVGGTVFVRQAAIAGRQWEMTMTPVSPLLNPRGIDGFFAMSLLISFLSGVLIFRMHRSSAILAQMVERRTERLEQMAGNLNQQRQDALHAAAHDSLTGLLNKTGLNNAFQEWHLGSGQSVSVMSIDLDHFKDINDTSGYETGNDLLIAVSQKLRDVLPANSLVSRAGADEFQVVLGDDNATELANQIVDWAKQPLKIAGADLRFGASVGISNAQKKAADLGLMLADSEMALGEAKKSGRGLVRVFDEEMRSRAIATKSLADDLRRAVEQDEFEPFFQTQHSARDFSVTGVECLIRWRHPTRGILPPAAFLDVAEAAGLLREIDAIALRKSIDVMIDLENAGVFLPKISVNVSLDRLRDSGLIQSLTAAEKMHATLTFEVLETVFIDDVDHSLKTTLCTLEQLGIAIEVDDFGSGRASILGLISLNPSQLKIDRALVMPLLDRPEQRALLQSIVAMGRSLDIGIVAEGVETEAHANILQEIGVDILQGYHFSKPISARDLGAKLGLLAA